jgi:hypothetical protein
MAALDMGCVSPPMSYMADMSGLLSAMEHTTPSQSGLAQALLRAVLVRRRRWGDERGGRHLPIVIM